MIISQYCATTSAPGFVAPLILDDIDGLARSHLISATFAAS